MRSLILINAINHCISKSAESAIQAYNFHQYEFTHAINGHKHKRCVSMIDKINAKDLSAAYADKAVQLVKAF